MIRARIFRDGLVWGYSIADIDAGLEYRAGQAGTQQEAFGRATEELQVITQLVEPEPEPLVSQAAFERGWLARLLRGAAQ